jgi:hypothetical protein
MVLLQTTCTRVSAHRDPDTARTLHDRMTSKQLWPASPYCCMRIAKTHHPHPHPPPTAAATAAVMYLHDRAAAPELVIGCSVKHLMEANQRQCPSTHDAGLHCHIQLAPAHAQDTSKRRERERVPLCQQELGIDNKRATIDRLPRLGGWILCRPVSSAR